MPIEIKELVIKSTINDSKTDNFEHTENSQIDIECLIADCVDQVMEILKEKSER